MLNNSPRPPMFGGSAVPLQEASVLPRHPPSSCSSRPLSAGLQRVGPSPRVLSPCLQGLFFGHAHWRLCARDLVILFEPLPPWRRACLGFGWALSLGGLEGFCGLGMYWEEDIYDGGVCWGGPALSRNTLAGCARFYYCCAARRFRWLVLNDTCEERHVAQGALSVCAGVCAHGVR